ncbi:endonuclease/exonuclease/phosphatase family protein [Sphingorhabdus sp. Alg239-R122]|uniref:endonuclease/exonuclease/phosphatase family protein n=1 Tax=Sphingorhabdus sp. Alg239-R122 TaxID=2305989 RepID=UPI0013DAB508|nr:endonuclease/exonuclease/phosphatase family protein [Sphingorhabdus sp. Alg239-R122]
MDRAGRVSHAGQPLWRRPGFYLHWIPRLAVIGLALWLLSWFAIGDSLRYLGFIHSGAFIYGLMGLLAAVIMAVRRDFIWAGLGAVLALGVLSHGNGYNMSAGEAAKEAGSIRVVSASLRGRNRQMEAAAERLASYDADIIAVQEVSDFAQLSSALEKASGMKWQSVSKGPLSIFARGPVEYSTGEELDSVLKAQISYKGNPLAIWTIRAPKNYARPAENRAFSVALRNSAREEKPHFVVGDYNATQWNDSYVLMDAIMQNAQASAGLGQGSSFPARGRRSGILGAFARIDHIFVRNDLKVHNAFTGQASAGADHHPVIADVTVRP